MSSDLHTIAKILTETGGTLSTAESCTGGLLAESVTSLSGSSTWFRGGWVTYSNEMKETQLHVCGETLSKFGAVSWQVAKAMCVGACSASGSSVALSTTGIAGPGGATLDKPVGTVYIGCTAHGMSQVRHFVFQGDRQAIRNQASKSALEMLLNRLEKREVFQMEFQVGEVIQ